MAMTKKIQRERFKELIKCLEFVRLQERKRHRKFLDLGAWKCDTSACAIGWFAQTDFAEAKGLTLLEDNGFAYPTYKGQYSYTAVSHFFDISYANACYLFEEEMYDNDSSNKVSTGQVIRRIKDFCIEKGIFIMSKGEGS